MINKKRKIWLLFMLIMLINYNFVFKAWREKTTKEDCLIVKGYFLASLPVAFPNARPGVTRETFP